MLPFQAHSDVRLFFVRPARAQSSPRTFSPCLPSVSVPGASLSAAIRPVLFS